MTLSSSSFILGGGRLHGGRRDAVRIGSRSGSLFGRDYGAGRRESAAHPVSFLRSERSGGQSDSAARRFLRRRGRAAEVPRASSSIKLVDAFGLPVSGARSNLERGLRREPVINTDTVTDSFGIAGAARCWGPQPGTYSYRVTAGGMSYTFTGFARPQPTISSIVDGATLLPGALRSRLLHRHQWDPA